ncbi:putative disease resistance protein At1g50180 [Cannabis sativa]|uniref:putative disease resistance protein At1g50180 n=1 Tax=Cannabis sativa TaxID=3483 RepID=UPI0029CA26B0|nr:putative disease resistance protein At1g50180 [Cannabis sativa]
MAESLLISQLAEAVVSQAVGRLSELIINEGASLSSVKADVERLRDELHRMHCFFEDADRRPHHQDKRLRHWISELRGVANDVEDVIEMFISNVSSSCLQFFYLRRLRSQINSIKTKMEDIFKSSQTYRIESSSRSSSSSSRRVEGTSSSVSELQRRLRRSCPDDNDDDDYVVSMEHSVKALKDELIMLKKEDDDDQLSIVSVVGMGGLGKTTLAKLVYKSNDVKQHFDCCAWVFICQQYVSKDILYEILVQIDRGSDREKIRNLNENEMSDRLKSELKGKRYLVVLDDIWRIEAWDCIKRAFPLGNSSSKVLFTTRNKELALSVNPCSSPIEPSFLTFEESWQVLVQRQAFRRSGFGLEFEMLGKDMVKKCGGLPLAIVVLGGLLRTRSSLEEWKEVQKDVNSHLNKLQSHQEYEGVNGILALSYYDLPYYLKPCFLYLGSFPEDRDIEKKTLIRLWIAEGFVQKLKREEANEETLENVCEQYLRELTNRCMIQVSKRNNSGVGVKTYRVHDLMRDLCVSKAKEENFFQVIQHQNESNMSEQGGSSIHHGAKTIFSRKIVLHVGCDLDLCKVQLRLHSLLCFDNGHFLVSSLRKKTFMFLRTLILGNTCLGDNNFKILKQICTLIHLRYLGLQKSNNLHKLPKCIANLRSLHTLDLRYSNVKMLPTSISRLTRLTHLMSDKPLMLMDKESGNKFLNFAVLSVNPAKPTPTNPAQPTTPMLIRDVLIFKYDVLLQLTNLQELKMLLRSKEEATKVLESAIIKGGRIRSLDLDMVFHGHVLQNQLAPPPPMPFPSLKSLSKCYLLNKLRLRGPIEKDSLQFLSTSLVKLTLEHTCIQQDPMAVLEQLPNLKLLQLHSFSYIGSKLVCSANGFPKLETLRLCHLQRLKEWEIEKDSMQCLKRLELEQLLKLKMIPDGLKFVTTLRQLDVIEMTEIFEERIKVSEGLEGEDYNKVRHIPSISTRRLY